MMNESYDLNGDGKLDPEEMELAKKRWETKRKIVWLCLFGMFFFGLLFVGLSFTGIAEAKLKIVSDVLTTAMFGFMTVIASYFGISAYAGKGK